MALIKWQTNARTHLRSIYNYYKKNVSLKVASAIRDTIVTSVDILENFPASGTVDFELSTQDTTYFFSVAKKGKRTYRVYYIYENDTCYILAIWDNSMNPSRRKRRVVPKKGML